MSQKPILLKNATFINEGATSLRDILIKDNRIEKIDNFIRADNSYEVMDVSDMLVLPGVIDDQVHFREPGATHKATIFTESRAAVLGGTTSFMDMPNNNPPCTTKEAINNKNNIAQNDSLANYSFYLGATNDNLEEIKAIDPKTTCGVKIFMGSSTGNLLVDDDIALRNIFKSTNLPIATHCEDNEIIAKNLAAFKEKYHDNLTPSMHPLIRNHEACLKSSKKAVELAKETGANLHVLHLSTKEEVKLFEEFAHLPIEERKITAEVCAHHLYFSDKDYETLGNKIKCNPAIKTLDDRLALIKAVNNGVISVIATDHAPHTFDEKMKPYLEAPSGLPLVQFSLLAVLELVHEGKMTLETVVSALSHNVAKRFNILDRGFIKEGYFADLAIVKHEPFTVKPNIIASKCGWSPFTSKTFAYHVKHTIVSGNLVVKDSKIISDTTGMMLNFNR